MHEIRQFLDSENRLIQLPAKRKMKMLALKYLAKGLESGRRYSEKEINERLNSMHTFGDPATLRRELYDHHFINRDRYGREYSLEDIQPTDEELGLKE